MVTGSLFPQILSHQSTVFLDKLLHKKNQQNHGHENSGRSGQHETFGDYPVDTRNEGV